MRVSYCRDRPSRGDVTEIRRRLETTRHQR
jgi:hypothetical protein